MPPHAAPHAAAPPGGSPWRLRLSGAPVASLAAAVVDCLAASPSTPQCRHGSRMRRGVPAHPVWPACGCLTRVGGRAGWQPGTAQRSSCQVDKELQKVQVGDYASGMARRSGHAGHVLSILGMACDAEHAAAMRSSVTMPPLEQPAGTAAGASLVCDQPRGTPACCALATAAWHSHLILAPITPFA